MIGNRSLTKANIFDAGANQPERKRREWYETDEDGNEVLKYEKRSYMPCEKWVHRSGTVAHVPMGNGSAAGYSPAYAERTRAVLRQRHSIPYGVCPLETGDLDDEFFPPSMRDQCKRKAGHGEHKACPHVEFAIKKWQAGQMREASRSERKHQGLAARQVQAQQAQTDALLQLVAKATGAGEQPATAPTLTRTVSGGQPEFSDPEPVDDDELSADEEADLFGNE